MLLSWKKTLQNRLVGWYVLQITIDSREKKWQKTMDNILVKAKNCTLYHVLSYLFLDLAYHFYI